MVSITNFTTAPEPLYFEKGKKKNRVWMRKNIREVTTANEDKTKLTSFDADEVYFETVTGRSDIAGNFDAWFEYGTTWDKYSDEPNVLDNEALTKGYESLQNQQVDICDAIAGLYESIAGGAV